MFADTLAVLLSLPFATAGLYLAVLALLAARPPRKPPAAARLRSFTLVVPAHNEAASIGRTLDSLARIDYPPALTQVLVVADNCTDATATIARRHGAMVLERHNPLDRGKGFAVQLGINHALTGRLTDAVVVVDADTRVSPSLLHSFNDRLEAGAAVIQAEYRVENARDTWRTALLDTAFVLFHRVRSLGRARLGFGAGLRGNGMCFSRRALEAVPYNAFGLTEDVEYGLTLARHGFTVAFAPDAEVYGDMPSGAEASARQRDRWEGGRRALLKDLRASTLWQALRKGNTGYLEAVADVAIPPLTQLAMYSLAGLGAAALAVWAGATPAALTGWVLAVAGVAIYVLGAIPHVGLARFVLTLSSAPAFIFWKLTSRAGRALPQTWVRSTRSAEEAR